MKYRYWAMLSAVAAVPPSPAQDLSLSERSTTNSMVLSWQSGDRPANYYKIYRYIGNNKIKAVRD